MTYTSSGPLQPLGATAIVGSTFSRFFDGFWRHFFIAFIPLGLMALVNGVVTQRQVSALGLGGGLPFDPTGLETLAYSGSPGMIVYQIVLTIVSLLIPAYVLVAFSMDQKGQTGVSGPAFRVTLRHALPVVILSLLFYIVFAFGFVLLVVPGLWLFGVFSVFLPAIVLEGRGLGAFQRSSDLTREYRWPAVGAILLLVLILIALGLVASVGTGFLVFGMTVSGGLAVGDVAGFLLVTGALNAVMGAIGYGLIAMFQLSLYERLLEIKEGGGPEISEVFA